MSPLKTNISQKAVLPKKSKKILNPSPASTRNTPKTIEAFLAQENKQDLLRFITCGSVDDGKSTLIGRLLWDSQSLLDDQIASLKTDSKKFGAQGEGIDFALLVDGLAAEREQGITIDVAYRYFATPRRKFIIADTPGHIQYTRNMVTGASTANLAIILIDARKGVIEQTCRHAFLANLLRIQHVTIAVNKMDLVDYSEDRFRRIVADYLAFADSIGITAFTAIPISGFKGDNVTTHSANMPWYTGLPLLAHADTVMRRALPGTTGQLVSLIKDSSLLSAIGIEELVQKVKIMNAATYKPLEGFLPLALAYLAVTLPLSRLARQLERRFAYET